MLHFTAFSRDYTLQRFFVLLNQPASHRRGRTLGLFLFSLFFFFDAPPPPAVLASIFYREKGSSAVPSLVDNDIEVCRLTKLFELFTAVDRQLRK